VADVQKLLRRTIPESIEIELALSSILDPIRADPGQLEQVLMNLAVNAAGAMPQGGRLRLQTGTVNVDEALARRRAPMLPGSYVRLVVSDTGCGMSPETQARAFEPFFTTKDHGKGTGLGLATVHGIIEQSGGFISVSSQLNVGTTFDIYLPVVHERLEAPIAKVRASEPVGGTETILLAEDDGAVRGLARSVLKKYGYRVLEARDGAEAMLVAKQSDCVIHMLMTDLVMPSLGGRELAGRLANTRPGIRVLFSSGYTVNTIKGVDRGTGLPILTKPYTPRALLHKVREILDDRGKMTC
jgi:two-component system, cell cycle sensor histidine kinase and response regulator CckA